jgi:hypothetical protein
MHSMQCMTSTKWLINQQHQPFRTAPHITHMSELILQFTDLLQRSRLRLTVFHKSGDVEHIVQVGKDLHLAKYKFIFKTSVKATHRNNTVMQTLQW